MELAAYYARIFGWEHMVDAYLFTDAMLQYLKDYCMGSLVCLNRTDKSEDDSCHEEWDKVLDQMNFLWRESYKYSSSKKNPYQEEYMEILDKYYDKYGSNMGLAMMRNDSKYKKISDKYEKAEGEINQCREKCKEKTLDMPKEYFYFFYD